MGQFAHQARGQAIEHEVHRLRSESVDQRPIVVVSKVVASNDATRPDAGYADQTVSLNPIVLALVSFEPAIGVLVVADEKEDATPLGLMRDQAPAISEVVLDAMPDPGLAIVRDRQGFKRVVFLQATEDNPDLVMLFLVFPALQIGIFEGFHESFGGPVCDCPRPDRRFNFRRRPILVPTCN
ncbi:hypothetical protein [Microvirga yunnanensis]|uniref:hypothetical protein n=1 Tax=Microvirga yunnanensis TaxID=2953740 RepID=UPI0021C61153|nr:hypothetical protein [Microvirga sp. HBU65207]